MQATRQRSKQVSERRLVEAIFRAEGLPGWLGWGTYGAESSYGKAGEFLFGGIDLPAGNTSNLALAARESARAYKRLRQETGSLAAAVRAYSGGSYTISHPRELARGGGQGKTVPIGFWEDFLEGFTEIPRKLGEGKAPIPKAEPGSPAETLGEIPGALSSLASTLTSGEFWLRALEVIGGAVLLYLGLKALTGVGAEDLPGAGIGKAAALGAVTL